MQLPQEPFDGMTFIDAYQMQWAFDDETQCWLLIGKADTIPLANSRTIGLLSNKHKSLIDRIPEKGGGFALITKPQFNFRNEGNPDGLLLGDVILRSESFDIRCVFSDGREIKPECGRISFWEYDEIPPGFDINFSEKLLNNLCLEIPSGRGPEGCPGPKGKSGKDGYGDGPKGLKGDPGKDAMEHYKISEVKIVDVEDIFDTAIVRLDLDADTGKLFVTKGKMNVPNDENSAANRIVASQIDRDIIFSGSCFDYKLTVGPCRVDDDFTEPDPTIAYYPSHFDPKNLTDPSGNRKKFQLIRKNLSNLVNDVVDYYQNLLNKAAETYDEQIVEFIKNKDAEARQKLDILGDRLAECENITYLEYCLAPIDCATPSGAHDDIKPNDVSATSPECSVVANVVGCPDSDCRILGTTIIPGNVAPIFSFKSPGPPIFTNTRAPSTPPSAVIPDTQVKIRICSYENEGGCRVKLKNASGSPIWTIAPGGRIPPDSEVLDNAIIETKTICIDIQGNERKCIGGLDSDTIAIPVTKWYQEIEKSLNAGKVIYKKTQLKSSQSSYEFPPGTYAFVYQSGAFRQTIHPNRNPNVDNNLYMAVINGSWQEYYVGNEGDGKILTDKYYMRVTPEGYTFPTPRNVDAKPFVFSAPILFTEIGAEIGFTPNNYVSKIPEKFFTEHVFDPAMEGGNAFLELPMPRIDFKGIIDDTMMNEENKIQWKGFSPVEGDKSDLNGIQLSYLGGPSESKIVFFQTLEPGFFFTRMKTAFSVTNSEGSIVMPPVRQYNLRSASVNVAKLGFSKFLQYSKVSGWTDIGSVSKKAFVPFINARPIAEGSATIQIVQVNCKVNKTTSETGGTNIG